jgi:hypothetical protein
VNTVLRITLTYFSVVPLQKWLSITGVLLITLALLMRSPPFAIASGLGVVFLVMVPALLGGASMRLGSSRTVLQLRPYSRWRMLAAALLTACLMTLVCVFIRWAVMLSGMGPANGNTSAAQVTLAEFALAIWGGLSILWLVSFVGSGSGMWATLFGVGFIAMTSNKWEPLRALGSPPIVLATVGAACWVGFAFWYQQVLQVRRPGRMSSSSPMGMGENNTGGWYSSMTESRSDSRAVAIKAYLLGTTSQIGFLLPGIMSALVVLPIYFLQRKQGNGVVMLPVTFLTIFSGVAGGMSYMVARRARMLWLRAGLDRAGLFALGERTAAQAFSQMVISAALVLGIFSIVVKPEMTPRILVFIATQVAFATVLFYFGLSRTRNWTAAGIAACIVLGLGMILQMILLLPQTTGIPPVIAPALFGISVSLALLLRQHARRRWLSLDWHLTRPPVVQRQTH